MRSPAVRLLTRLCTIVLFDGMSSRIRFWFKSILSTVVLFSSTLFALTTGEDVPTVPDALIQKYAAAKSIPAEYQKHFREKGDVWVGRLVTPSDARVASRTAVLRDGSFATALYPGRQLVFYAHGYDPLRVEHGEEIMPSVRDAGELMFTRTAPEKLRVLKGTAKLANAAANQTTEPQISSALLLINNDYLYRDHGHRGGLVQVKVQEIKLTPGAPFRFDGISPLLPYSIKFSAPGFITQTRTIDPAAVGEVELHTIELQAAPVLNFRYLSQLNLDARDSWKAAEVTEKSVVCDGDNEFVYTDQRDRLRNRLYLRLKPGEDGVKASFWAYPSEFRDLGPGGLEASVNDTGWLDQPPEARNPSEQILRPGRVYFFQNRERGTNCLFEVVAEPAPAFTPVETITPPEPSSPSVKRRPIPHFRYPVKPR